jgi:hypothetical protein
MDETGSEVYNQGGVERHAFFSRIPGINYRVFPTSFPPLYHRPVATESRVMGEGGERSMPPAQSQTRDPSISACDLPIRTLPK